MVNIRLAIMKELQIRNKTVRSLSEDTGINVSNISRILRGGVSPKVETVQRILDSLNLELCVREKNNDNAQV